MAPTWAGPGLFTFSRKPTKPDVPKRSPLWIFFGTVRLFFENFFNVPFDFFLSFASFQLRRQVRPRGQGKLSAKGPPFRFLIFQGNLQNRTGLKSPPF